MSSLPPQPRKAFISYSWGNDAHMAWVKELATRLRKDGVDVTLDRWVNVLGDRLTKFMTQSVLENDYVLIVCSPEYKQKASRPTGGVRYEGDLMSAEIYATGEDRKFIPVLREGDIHSAFPTWLAKDKLYADLRGDPYSEESYLVLLNTLLYGRHETFPPVGTPPPDAPAIDPTAPESPVVPTGETVRGDDGPDSSGSKVPSLPQTGHPTGLWFFLCGEFAERFSYYGMRSILALYLFEQSGFTHLAAQSIYSWFKTALFLLPLLGGFLADRFFGRYWTIVGFTVPYVLGHLLLGIREEGALIFALSALAIGSGFIKPNIPTLMGKTYDQRRPGQQLLRSAAFLWFYWALDAGATLAGLAVPLVSDRYGYDRAFLVTAFVIVVALAAFASGSQHYAREVDCKKPTLDERRSWKALATLSGLFGLIVLFWVAYLQINNECYRFISEYSEFHTKSFPQAMLDLMYSSTSLFVLLLIPCFIWTFNRLDSPGSIFRPSRKLLLGFALIVLATGIGGGFFVISPRESLSILWIAGIYFVLAASEVLVLCTGLELAYAEAPENAKGFATGCFFCTNFAGDLIARLLPWSGGPLQPPAAYGISLLLIVAATVACYFVGKRLDRPIDQIAVRVGPDNS